MSASASGGNASRETELTSGRRDFLASLSAALGIVFFGRQAAGQQPRGTPIAPSVVNAELAKLGFPELRAPEPPDGFVLVRIGPVALFKFAKAPEGQVMIDIVRFVTENDTFSQERVPILIARQPAGAYPQIRDRQPARKAAVSKSTQRFELEYFDGKYAPPQEIKAGRVPADGWDHRHHCVVLRGTKVAIGTGALTRVLSREALERMIVSMV